MKHLDQLKKYLDSNKINLKIIIALPRTGSTMLETVLSSSPGIAAYSHEPFVRLGYYNDNADTGYKNILDSIKTNKAGKGSSVIIKDMSHWIVKDEAYKQLFSLTNAPILFLIRNPILTIESRLRRIIHTLNVKYKPAIRTTFKEQFQDIFKSDSANDQILFREQLRFLDKYAKLNHEQNWDLLVSKCLVERNYTLFDKLLAMKDLFPADISGLEALWSEIQYVNKNKQPYLIIDSTELRLSPERQIINICKMLGIEFNQKMLHWGKKVESVHTGQNEPHHKVWYDTLMASNQILPPTEIPLDVNQFPETLKTNLLNVILPIYSQLFLNRYKLHSRKNILDLKFHSPTGKITIKDIDPLFVLLSDRSLNSNSKFIKQHEYFFKNINAINLIKILANNNHE